VVSLWMYCGWGALTASEARVTTGARAAVRTGATCRQRGCNEGANASARKGRHRQRSAATHVPIATAKGRKASPQPPATSPTPRPDFRNDGCGGTCAASSHAAEAHAPIRPLRPRHNVTPVSPRSSLGGHSHPRSLGVPQAKAQDLPPKFWINHRTRIGTADTVSPRRLETDVPLRREVHAFHTGPRVRPVPSTASPDYTRPSRHSASPGASQRAPEFFRGPFHRRTACRESTHLASLDTPRHLAARRQARHPLNQPGAS